MHVDHHPLISEFPEYKEKIHAIKMGDHHLSRYFSEYEELDKKICRAEDNIEPMGDSELEGLKLKRVHLKDFIGQALAKE